MFVREKQIGPYRYLYLVESVREGGRTKQRIIKNLGRKENVDANGDLDRLARSAARMAQRSMILSLLDQGSAPALATRRIGPPLAFERLWRETGCRDVIEDLAAERGFGGETRKDTGGRGGGNRDAWGGVRRAKDQRTVSRRVSWRGAWAVPPRKVTPSRRRSAAARAGGRGGGGGAVPGNGQAVWRAAW